MSKAIAKVLREAARQENVHHLLGASLPNSNAGSLAYEFAWGYMSSQFFLLTNEERSAFLYLCSLIAEDEE